MRDVEPDLDGLLDAFEPGTPFGEELERSLRQTGGPVRQDVEAARLAAERLGLRIGSTVAPPRRRHGFALGVCAAVAFFGLFVSQRSADVVFIPEPSSSETAAFARMVRAPGARYAIQSPALLLERGAVRIPDAAGGDLLRLQALGVALRASEQADWVVGVEGETFGVGVLSGEVTLMGLGEDRSLVAGQWLLYADHQALPFGLDQPPDWRLLSPVTTETGHQLVGTLRWLSLPEATRQAVSP